jgi:Siphovirus ReqiPepy6 Gp37-like protein
MKVTDLLVEVRDSTLNRVGQIPADYLTSFTTVLRYNAISTWTVTLPADHKMATALKTPGAGIVVTYNGTVLVSGPTTWVQTIQTVNDPDGVVQVTGLDDSVILRDRLAYPTPTTADVTLQTSAYDIRTGVAETVMKAYVDANIGPSAPTARKISTLTVEGTLGRGPSIKGSARFDVLYELLQSLADASLNGGTALGFDIVQVGTGLVFQVYAPTDRSKTIRMDIANNRLTESNYSLAQPKFTRAIVAGQGDGAARAFLERTSTVSLAAETAWGRRIESFVDARDAADSTALATSGDAALATDGKAQITASVKPTDDSSMLFGKDWFLGDTVTVVVGSYELAAVVTELGISCAADGVRLYATVGEPKLQSYEDQIIARQADLAERMNNLERYK